MAKEIYNAIFLPPEAIDLIRDKLSENGIELHSYDNEISVPHATYEFRGLESMSDYFGQTVDIQITGYASDRPSDSTFSGQIEGVSIVVLPTTNDLAERFDSLENSRNDNCGRENGFSLHITLSHENDIKPVECGYLCFEEFPEDKQFIIKDCVFGGFFGNIDGEPNIDIGKDKEYKEIEVEIIDIEQPEDTSPDNEFMIEDFDSSDADY